MIPLSPSLLIASASSFIGVTQSGNQYLSETELFRHAPQGADEEAWGLHFLQHVGFRSHLDHRTRVSSWPLPAVRFIDDLASAAASGNALHEEIPRAGDVFVLWSPSKHRYVRTGIIVDVDPQPVTWPNGRRGYECTTIEAITRTGESGVFRKVVLRQRRLSFDAGDRIIRWTELPQGRCRFTEAA